MLIRSAASDSMGGASANPPSAPLTRLIPGPISSTWEEIFHVLHAVLKIAGSAAEEDADRVQEDRKSCDQQRYDDDCQDDKNNFSSFSQSGSGSSTRPCEPVRDPGFRRSCGGVVAGCGRLRCRVNGEVVEDNGEVVELDGGTLVGAEEVRPVGGAALGAVAGAVGGAGVGGVVGGLPGVPPGASADPD